MDRIEEGSPPHPANPFIPKIPVQTKSKITVRYALTGPERRDPYCSSRRGRR